MSTCISLAQQLPINVLRIIIKMIVGETSSPFRDRAYWTYNLRELLLVCSVWRQMALECLWRKLQLNITKTIRLSRPKWIKNNGLPSAIHLIRELYVDVSMSSIINGTFHKLLTEYVGDTKGFPMVNKLCVTVNDSKSELQDEEDAVYNIIKSAQFLKSLVPVTTVVKLTCSSDDAVVAAEASGIDILDEGYLSVFANSIYKDTQSAMLNLGVAIIKHWSTIDAIPLLSRLELNCLVSPTMYTSLVIKSAPVLQHLSIGISNASTLLCDASGNNVVYPSLQYLKMYYCDRAYPDSVASDLVVFPVLKYVKVSSAYPFTDDVLFRGNSATLTYLNIPVDKDIVEMLYRRHVFDNSRRVLHTVIVSEINGNEDLALVSETIINKFWGCLARFSKYLALPPSLLASIPVAQNSGCFNNVQVFDMSSGGLSFFDVLSLLKVFPVLTKLRCNIISLGSELGHIAEENIPDYIATTYSEVGKILQIWCMAGYNGQSSADLLNYILLLGLACPKFCRADVYLGLIPDYNASLAAALQSGPYRKYASQLSRLFYTQSIRRL